MDAKTKLTRSKVSLQTEKPFFAYLIMNMKFIEEKNIQSMGVDFNGNCYYNPKYVEGLNEGVLKGVFAHEVMHNILEHLIRLDKKYPVLWNIATDLCVNDLLIENGFELDKDGLIPNAYDNHSFTFELGNGKSLRIEDINKKTADDVYEELLKVSDKNPKSIAVYDKKRFDEHRNGKKGELSKQKTKELQDKWKKAVSEASTYARQKGNMPNGLKLFVDELLNEQVNWKHLLYRYLTRTIPYDYSYARQSKRSFATGVYMPIMRKESIEIVVSLDTSGSISKSELQEFLSEINGIARSFSNLKMKLIVCDSEIKDVYELGNGDDETIKNLIIRGGGGTSHKPVYEYVEENLPNTKLLVNFTDGWTDYNEIDSPINTLWVICKNGIDENRINFGEVIKLN